MIDPELFKNDLISNYFHSVAPIGYKFSYWLGAKSGISPLILAKIIPIFLAIITTLYLFRFFLEILPISFGAFLATLILNINIWLKDDLVSGTPRAFVYPIFAAFLYYLVKRSLIPCLITIALQGLFFPQLVFVENVLLTIRLFDWQNNKIRFTQDQINYIFWFFGLVTSLIVLLPFALHVSEFGSVITINKMKIMPEYQLNGRIEYFGFNPFFLPFKSSSGLGAPIFPPFILLGLFLPLALKKSRIFINITILLQLFIASLMMFIIASFVPLILYFPGRYTYHILRFILAIFTAILICILIEYLENQLNKKKKIILTFGIILLLIPSFIPPLFLRLQEWRIGENPEIYHFYASKPKDILVASLASDTSNIPAFAKRSVLFSTEFALPIHPVYYNQMKQRAIDLIKAQYSTNLGDTQKLINKYGIDYIMLEPTTFSLDYLLQQKWLVNSSFNNVILKTSQQLKQGEIPALTEVVEQCSIKKSKNLTVLDAECITKIN
ncbi:hypothetical protein [Aphanothece hegewaldii]|uniref:hypothetical protein n=1 Tax=Aphanothece hegewaldii TaxID=1521625 RepID=UPI001C62C9DF|nr:hypothetical protein [Aphanothece hegewaldii]